MKGKKTRLGAGSGSEMDRPEPAALLAEKGNINYLCMDTLAERTLALAQRRKLADPTKGYCPSLEARTRAVLPHCVKNNVKIICNSGAANPQAAADVVLKIVQEMGFSRLKVATVIGDDVLHLLSPDITLWETGKPLGMLKGDLVSANAYIGARPIVAALGEGADIVITGRCADPSLFLAPLIFEFGWKADEWDLLGAGIVIGHLLECTGQCTGGNYWDPGYTQDIPDLAHIGYPIAEVYEDGEAIISKVAGTGGIVTPHSCKAQLTYEIHDPAAYFTPDVTADFTHVTFEQTGKDQVRVSGGRGSERPAELKVSIGVMEGYMGDAEVGWAGPGSYEKAKIAAAGIKENLMPFMDQIEEFRTDFIGVSSVFGPAAPEPAAEPNEIRLRVAARTKTEAVAARLGWEITQWVLGPVGAGGMFRETVRPVLAIYSTSMPRKKVITRVITNEIAIQEVKEP